MFLNEGGEFMHSLSTVGWNAPSSLSLLTLSHSSHTLSLLTHTLSPPVLVGQAPPPAVMSSAEKTQGCYGPVLQSCGARG